jgi:nitroreductase
MNDIFTHDVITKAIHKSQHCQRNWDLSKTIPDEDLALLVTAATQCPSKQNVAFYKVHFVTNRDIIENIHKNTVGFGRSMNPTDLTTNSQTLANLLVVLESYVFSSAEDKIYRSPEVEKIKRDSEHYFAKPIIERDRNMAVGIAAGYLNMTATLLGYSTGCCACFDSNEIKKILNVNGDILLLMGIGFKNPNMNRRVHHVETDFMFPTKKKQPIPFSILK